MPLLIDAHCHTAVLSCSGVYETMEKLNTLSDTRDDFIHTLYSFAIPALVAAGEGQADIITKLQVKSLFHIIKAKLQGIKQPFKPLAPDQPLPFRYEIPCEGK